MLDDELTCPARCRMGGLVSLDSLRALEDQGWPNIIGMIAFDTPFWGLNPAVFKVRPVPPSLNRARSR